MASAIKAIIARFDEETNGTFARVPAAMTKAKKSALLPLLRLQWIPSGLARGRLVFCLRVKTECRFLIVRHTLKRTPDSLGASRGFRAKRVNPQFFGPKTE